MATKILQLKAEEGVSLVGVVFSVVLILLVGGGAVYGYSAFSRDEKSGNERDSSTVSVDRSIIRSTLQTDVSGASALQSPSSESLRIARADGSCVDWKILPASDGSKTLMRAASFNSPANASSGSDVTRKFQSGSFSVAPGRVDLRLNYTEESSLSESVNVSTTNSDGGVCW